MEQGIKETWENSSLFEKLLQTSPVAEYEICQVLGHSSC